MDSAAHAAHAIQHSQPTLMVSAALEASEMKRRRFLVRGGQLAAAITGAALANGGISLPASVDPDEALLGWIAQDLTRLRRREGIAGPAAVAVPIVGHADHLFRLLVSTPARSPLRRQVAALAAEAASLAGWCAREHNEREAALGWYRAGTAAAKAAHLPDWVVTGLDKQAGVLGPGRQLEALALFAQMPLEHVTPATRGTMLLRHAEKLAKAGKPAWTRKLAEAESAMRGLPSQEATRWMQVMRVQPDALVARYTGRCYLAAGNAESAYTQLTETLGLQPGGLYRDAGTIHVELGYAAIGTGEIDRACGHLLRAHATFARTHSSYRLATVERIRATLLAPYEDTRAVRELDQQCGLAAERRGGSITRSSSPRAGTAEPPPAHSTGQQYMRIRPGAKPDPRLVVHRVECRVMKRAVHARPWSQATGRTPAELAADPDVRATSQPCHHCLGPLWV